MHCIGGGIALLETSRFSRWFDLSTDASVHHCTRIVRTSDTVRILHGVFCGIIQRCYLRGRRTHSRTHRLDGSFRVPCASSACRPDSIYRTASPPSVGVRLLGCGAQRGVARLPTDGESGLPFPPWMAISFGRNRCPGSSKKSPDPGNGVRRRVSGFKPGAQPPTLMATGAHHWPTWPSPLR